MEANNRRRIRRTMRLPAILSMEVRRATPRPAVQVSAKSPADMERGWKEESAVPAWVESRAASRTCPQAYGRRSVMEEVTPRVAAEARIRFRSGLDSSYNRCKIS